MIRNDDKRLPQWATNKDNVLVVLGAGESGVGAAILGKERGMKVFVSDNGKISDKYRAILDEEHIEYEDGGHTPERIMEATVAVKSPGIPPTVPMVRALVEKGVPVLSEIEFAAPYTDAKMICITGSNGKTTTTLLTYHILKRAGLDVGLAGNVGQSLALQVARSDHKYYVVELSSFQLENMYDFKAHIAVILNITPDHMDRYDHKMENYVAAKFRILQNQTAEDYFIYWQEDPVIMEQIRQLQIESMQMPFSHFYEDGSKAYEEDGIIRFITPGEVWEIPRDKLSLTGLHNLYNSMAAGLSASLLDIRNEDIRTAMEDFESVEHRLEYVDTIDGVRYVNDSKATNVNSTWYALESMTSPTVLILGGKDKGNDYSEIADLVHERVKAIVCMGKDNGKLLEFFGGYGIPVVDTHSVTDAVAECRRLASEGDTVLLSPCCASFDLFSSYEDRGRQFKAAVRALKG